MALATTKNGGAVSAVYTVNASDTIATSNGSYTDVSGMAASVTVPAGQQALLLITFSASDKCTEAAVVHAQCFVRARVDGGTDASPGPAIFDSAEDSNQGYSWEADSMQFVVKVGQGTHNIKMQWKVDQDGGTYYMGSRILTVLRSPAS
jgi:hypothetical protein